MMDRGMVKCHNDRPFGRTNDIEYQPMNESTRTANATSSGDRATATLASRPAEVIRLEGVSRVFAVEDVETRALWEVDLVIERGQFVAIAGPSGCGKTTLLSILGLLDSPTAGSYHLDGESVTGLGHAQRARLRNRKIGFVFQNFNLIGDLTVEQNVELPLGYQSLAKSDRKLRVREVLERVELGHRARHYPSQLSGGQQQRAAVARALVVQPHILLADEPTGNLDSKNAEAIMQLLTSLHEAGATIAMVTHDPRYVGYARRIVELLDGSVVNDRSAGK
jgi:putative ABC transport system ATP-binding protein